MQDDFYLVTAGGESPTFEHLFFCSALNLVFLFEDGFCNLFFLGGASALAHVATFECSNFLNKCFKF